MHCTLWAVAVEATRSVFEAAVTKPVRAAEVRLHERIKAASPLKLRRVDAESEMFGPTPPVVERADEALDGVAHDSERGEAAEVRACPSLLEEAE